jgi:hypothetical protein
MEPLKTRAREALIGCLRESLPPDRAALVDDTGRSERFEDNLVASLSAEQVAALRKQLIAGDGRELEHGADGSRPDGHAAHSSAALAFNAFGAWLTRESELVIDGVGGFSDPLRIEAKQRIFRGGRAPNLDCLASGAEVVVGVESKLTEPLARHGTKTWSEAYGRDSCRALLTDGWLEVLDAARAGSYRTRYLDVDQLLKHALGLCKQNPGRELHLVYVFWEPANAADFDELRAHRDEVQALLDRVGDALPRLHALTYSELWRQWDALDLPWLREHLTALRRRYDLSVA